MCVLFISHTWGAVYELQVVQGSSSTHVHRANPLKYHLKVPQLSQGDLCSVPVVPLMPRFVPHLPQIVLCLRSRAASTKDYHVVPFLVTTSTLISSPRASKWIQSCSSDYCQKHILQILSIIVRVKSEEWR